MRTLSDSNNSSEFLASATRKRVIADLQIHSRYSKATSNTINLDNLEKYARLKGLNLLGTGDITHPLWLGELKKELKEDGSGILTSKSGLMPLSLIEVPLGVNHLAMVILRVDFLFPDKNSTSS